MSTDKEKHLRVFVIGGTRRCGPYMIKELVHHGHAVICYHRSQNNVSFDDRAEHLHGDRRDYPRFKEQVASIQADAVIDMMAGDDRDVHSIVESFRGRIQRYVCISSYEVYAAFEAAWNHTPSDQPVPIPEDARKRQGTHLYGAEKRYDKILVEREVGAAQARGDFETTLLRWPALYGPRDPTPREWYYVRQARDHRTSIAVPEGGAALFPRGYLENMAHTAVLAVESAAAAGQVYNAADAEALSLHQIVEGIGEILGHRWEIVSIPRSLIRFPPRSQGNPYSWDPYDIVPHLLLNVSKLRTELGYKDCVPVLQALENTVRWLHENPPEVDWPAVDYVVQDRAIERSRKWAAA